jgi:hypothetical protein
MSIAKTEAPLDLVAQQILDAVKPYQDVHTHAEIEVGRSNPASVGLRIIDNDFHGMNRVDRENAIWPLIANLSEEVQSELSMLVLVTQDEKKTSLASLTFWELYANHVHSD